MEPEPIPAPEADYLYIAASGIAGAGHGLYTAIEIHRGELIARYHGERLSQAEAARRAAMGQDRYFMELPDGGILDTGPVEGFAKYANDARPVKGAGGAANNARITLDGHGTPCLMATRRIRAGQEVLCNYGRRYWARHGTNNG